MLTIIASVYGGQVRLGEKESLVQWVVNDSATIKNKILPLLAEYPPLTTRMHLQLAFMIQALNGMSIEEYLSSRNKKYLTRDIVTPLFISTPDYFPSWLSGFIEAEGAFPIRATSGKVGFSFSVSQTNDEYLITAIRDYFNQSHLTIQVKRGAMPLYLFEMYNHKGMEAVVNHCLSYPLLGYKYYQLALAIDNSILFAHLRNRFYT